MRWPQLDRLANALVTVMRESIEAGGSSLRDYYSRFDNAYPSISTYLDASTCTYSLSPTSATVAATCNAFMDAFLVRDKGTSLL